MPGKVKVKIIAGKNLPVMDRSNDTTDAYVEIKLGNTTYKTDVCRKSLNPQWNSDWYRFEGDDSELQDEPLQIKLMDHDTYSANDTIGKVYLDLNPLLSPSCNILLKSGRNSDVHSSCEHITNSVLAGWFPVYDTLHGIRGEVHVMVKVDLFSDFNKFRQSSCGVQFFCSPAIPHGYEVEVYHGFVEELIVNDDPEYQWIDKIRTPRASNEARQTLFFKLARELKRRIGVKTLGLGGNAVVGYTQCFDLEGELGIVIRGIGTAVTLSKHRDVQATSISDTTNEEIFGSPDAEPVRHTYGHQRTESYSSKMSQSPAKFHQLAFAHRRSSDSDLSITPKGNSLTGSEKSYGLSSGYTSKIGPARSFMPHDNFEMLEYPFITMTTFPPGFIIHLGGIVSARSVKVLNRITNFDEPESRDSWWTELRMEIRSHARTLYCNAVLAYSETSSICEGVCVLSASGTAAVVSMQCMTDIGDSWNGLPYLPKQNIGYKDVMASSLDRTDFDRERIYQRMDSNLQTNIAINTKPLSESPQPEATAAFAANMTPCSMCHLSYSGSSVPLKSVTLKCASCRSGKVPEVLLATIELPEGIPIAGQGCFVQAYVCRKLKDMRNESVAKDISDGLPFLEYELHRILLNKMRIKGMNSIFGLTIRISVGTKMIVGFAIGTALYLLPLPTPQLPKLVSHRTVDEKQLVKMQKFLNDTVEANKELYQLKQNENIEASQSSPEKDDLENEPFLDLAFENREYCILEIDDPEDMEIMHLLMEPRPPNGFHVVNTEMVPGLEDLDIVRNLQMFTQIWRSKPHPSYKLGKHINKLLQSVYFKLRSMIPCVLCNLKFRVDLLETDEIQLTLLGMALGLTDPLKSLKSKRKNLQTSTKETVSKNDDDMIFNLEEDCVEANASYHSGYPNVQSTGRSPHRNKVSSSERHSIDITPLSYIPNGKIERYLGNLNFFFIRETTSIREEGGLSGFMHSFITEVLAIVRAHITALGGNAMVAYYMTECVLSHSLHKNQGQCLIHVGGDVVFVSYSPEEPYI